MDRAECRAKIADRRARCLLGAALRRICAIYTLVVAGFTLTLPVFAQDPVWRLVADGELDEAWASPRRVLLDSAATHALAYLHDRGYWRAVLDSARTDAPAAAALAGTLYARRGEPIRIGALHLATPDSLALRAALDLRVGAVLDAERLRADLRALAVDYERRGFPLAAFTYATSPPRTHREDSGTWIADVTITPEPGPRLRVLRVEATGEGRTRGAYLARAAGLRIGAPLGSYDPERIRRRLVQTGFFRRVGLPELYVTPDSGAVVRIPVEDEAPGTFDVVVGVLPQALGGVQVVGNGRMELRNAFGAGRSLRLRLDRLPRQVSRAEVAVSDPFVAGTAFGASVGFEGAQQDSLYNQQRYRVGASYALGEAVRVGVTVSREATRPGPAGLRFDRIDPLTSARAQRIPTATAQFAGVELSLRRLDRPANPRRGLLLDLRAERGTKDRSQRQITTRMDAPADTAIDTTRVRQRLAQERLEATVRGFIPTARRQLVALGLDARLLVSPSYDASDLYRFGGATSLRGYDEDQYLGRFVVRALAEYRVQIDRTSYAYAFFDLGFVDDPGGDGLPEQQSFHPGYGLGIQFTAPVGLLVVTYALNPEDSATSGRVHVGLSFGL